MSVKLIEFVKSGNLDGVRRQLAGGCDVNYSCPPDGATALYWAACKGHLSVCNWLVRYGADVNQAVDKSGSLPLHGAADRGHVDCVLLLIRKGSNIDAKTKSNDDTALHLAAYRGHVTVCRLLLLYGACAEALNAQGCTALDQAQMQSHYDIYQLIWKHLHSHRSFSGETHSVIPRLSKTSAHQPKSLISKQGCGMTEVTTSSPIESLIDSAHTNDEERRWEIVNKSCRRPSEEIYSFSDNESFFEKANNTGRHLSKLSPVSNNTKPVRSSGSEDVTILANNPDCENWTVARHYSVTEESVMTIDDDDDDDVTQELIRRLDLLVDYSDDLQVQLTVSRDDNDRLVRDNASLTRRLELLAQIAGAVDGANRAREESERRAVRAEFELATARRRCAALEDSVRALESRNRVLVQPGNCALCSTAPSSNRVSVLSGFGDQYELKPR